MKIFNIFRWIFRIILFILILVLVIDNIQTVEFNIFNIYKMRLPLIVITLIFFGVGVFIGWFTCFIRNLELKSKVYKLKKQLDELETSKKIN